MPAVGLEPISKFDIFGLYSDIVGFCSDIFGFSYPFIFLRYPLERTHYATRNATRKFLKDILVFWRQINKIFVSSQLYPKSSQNHPNSKGLSYHFGFLDPRTFRTLSDIFGHFRKNLLSNPTLTNYKQVKKSSVYATLQKYWRVLASILLVRCHILSILADICQNLSKYVLICVFFIHMYFKCNLFPISELRERSGKMNATFEAPKV